MISNKLYNIYKNSILFQLFSSQRIFEIDCVHFSQFIQGACPFIPTLVARIEVSNDHDDGLVRMDVLVGNLLDLAFVTALILSL